ncbi:MAG: ABC transporter ATP-binding protein [Clostridiales bacterium]|jgi:ABC-2 type transport system ATP-binding protein|nr:ABC transporter ATP-binding protein [Clostridiales bacterium]
MNALEIKGISKSFGQKKVLDDISFQVPENCVFGFIGANGAGKTTTMKMILGLLKPDNGTGSIIACGEKVAFGSSKTNRLIGYLPDVPEFYGYMRPKEYLSLCAEIAGLDKKSIKGRINELLELVGLSDANKKIGGYSRGMKQRLGVAQALISEPKLLICDEPTSALDPIGRKEILDILRQIKGKATVVFSTHILADVERICDRVAVLNKGKIALESAIGELKVDRKSKSISLEFDKEVDADEVARVLASKGMAPAKCEIAERSIESLFLEAVK